MANPFLDKKMSPLPSRKQEVVVEVVVDTVAAAAAAATVDTGVIDTMNVEITVGDHHHEATPGKGAATTTTIVAAAAEVMMIGGTVEGMIGVVVTTAEDHHREGLDATDGTATAIGEGRRRHVEGSVAAAAAHHVERSVPVREALQKTQRLMTRRKRKWRRMNREERSGNADRR